MDKIKGFIVKYFEELTAILIFLVAFLGTFFIRNKFVVLQFYYLPVLYSAFFLGRRRGALTAVLSILAIVFFAVAFPSRFFGHRAEWDDFSVLSAWGGFLLLASIAVGTLYERHNKRLCDLKNAYVGILEILSKYLESTDRYTKGHSVRVSELAADTAGVMGLSAVEVENIRVAGLLHDIGKVEISGEVLSKAADLTEEERDLLESHASRGANLLVSVGEVLKEVVPIVIAHHKYFVNNIDALKNKESAAIPLGARVVAVADAFDAMTTDRPYRKAMPPWEAMEKIVSEGGNQFDPAVIGSFKKVVMSQLEKV